MKKIVPDTERLHAFETHISHFDFLICVDLEATCDELDESAPPRALIVRPDEMETIEIGLAVVDLRTLELVELFQRFIRPSLHPILTPFCTHLTSIRQADVEAAKDFSEVASEVTIFLQKYSKLVWGSWGHYDADQLAADSLRAGRSPVLADIEYLDLERRYREIFACPSIGLRPAVEAFGLTWNGQCHRGIDDAKNLANLVALLLRKARNMP